MEVTESQIDIYFGWQERLLRKAMQARMQVHLYGITLYEGLSLLSVEDGGGSRRSRA